MSNLSEQNVLQFNLFKQFSQKRNIINKQTDLRNSTKYNLIQKSSNNAENVNILSKNQQRETHQQFSYFNENIFMKNSDQLSQPHSRQQSIDKRLQDDKNLKTKFKDNLKEEAKLEYLQSQQNDYSSINDYGMSLSYSRMLSKFKDLNLQNFGRAIIKKLIEKQNKKLHILRQDACIDTKKGYQQIHQPLNKSNQNIDQKIRQQYMLNEQREFENSKDFNKKKGNQYTLLQQFNQNIAVTENLDPSQLKNGCKVYIDQNEQCSTLKTNESVTEYPINFLYTSKNSINELTTLNKDINQKQLIQQRINAKNNEQNVKSRHVQCGSINQNINHNNNKVTTNGSEFIMLSSLYESYRSDEIQNLSTQILNLTLRRKISSIKQRSMSTMRQRLTPSRNLSPENIIIPFNNFTNENKNIQLKQNLIQNRQRKIKSENQSQHFKTDVNIINDQDSLYFTQTLNTKTPLSPQQLSSPNNITRKKSNSVHFFNHNNQQQVQAQRKSSSNFRPSFKENIEKQPSRDLEQLEEIQKLLYIHPANIISQSQIKDVILPLFNNELIVRTNTTQTPRQRQIQQQQQQKQILNQKQQQQKQLLKTTSTHFRKFSLDKTNDIRNQQSYTSRNDYSSFIMNETNTLKTQENNNNDINEKFHVGELKKLDANKVFENLTINQQINDFKDFNKTQTAVFNTQNINSVKFIFSHQNFKKRYKSQNDKKIFKV